MTSTHKIIGMSMIRNDAVRNDARVTPARFAERLIRERRGPLEGARFDRARPDTPQRAAAIAAARRQP